ncbi:MAG TPA: hypothetical protein VGD62_00710 [Acidobacteriaceae bacterium]
MTPTRTATLALAALLLTTGCSKTTPSQPGAQPQPNAPAQQAMNPEAGGPSRQQAPQPAAPQPYQQTPAPQPYPQQGAGPYQQRAAAATTIPAGTRILVSVGQTISSRTAQSGDRFDATVAAPVIVRGATLIRAGAPATGTVVDAKALGRFKGGAELALRLDTVRAEGRTYRVASSTIERAEQGKGKRTAALTGGGAGLGGLIGGLAGGGKGLIIGGLAGAGAGGAGSAFTGNKDLVIPAESRLTFRLEHGVTLE